MLIVALTGGIATGKTIVAKVWQDLGCFLHSADQVAHDLMKPGTPAWDKIIERFGPGILAADKRIDRRKLGNQVFAQPQDREFLNALLHPLVLEKKRKIIARLQEQGQTRLFVSEAALIIESGTQGFFHKLVVTYCPQKLQLQRLMQRDGINKAMAVQKLQSQMPAEDKLTFADYIIRTHGSIAETIEQAEQVYRYLDQDARLLFPRRDTHS
jgi:dephospho-CoA kinase